MSGYLKVDMTRLSFAEAWRWGGLRYMIVLATWKLRGDELQDSGFEVAFWYEVEGRGSADSVAVAMLHESGRAVGMVAHVATGGRRRVSVGLVSREANGTYLSTGNARTAFDPPPEIAVLRLPGRPAPELCRAHWERLRGVDVASITKADVEPLILGLQTLVRDAALRRGLYVPMPVT